jgi:hypothetical protein
MTFEEFAAARLGALLRFAGVLTGDRALAEDVVQEVLIRAHGRWAAIARLDRPEAYVRKMLVNEYLSWRRRSWRLVPSGAGTDVDARLTADHAVDHAERAAILAELTRLPVGSGPSSPRTQPRCCARCGRAAPPGALAPQALADPVRRGGGRRRGAGRGPAPRSRRAAGATGTTRHHVRGQGHADRVRGDQRRGVRDEDRVQPRHPHGRVPDLDLAGPAGAGPAPAGTHPLQRPRYRPARW